MSSRRRTWLAEALFQGALILFGLLAALALNQWQDARQRAARADAIMVAIRAELAANLERLDQATAYNLRIVDALKQLRDAGATFIPERVYGNGGMFKQPRLTAAAWTAAQNGGVLEELPVDRILKLAGIYETQSDYQDGVSALFETLYETALHDTAYRRDGVEGAPQLAGVLSDFAGRGAALVRAYRSVLAYLDGAEQAPPAAESAKKPSADEPGATGTEPGRAAGERP